LNSKQNKQRFLLGIGLLAFLGLCGCTTKSYPPGVTYIETKYWFDTIDWSPDSKRLVGVTPTLPLEDFVVMKNPSEVYIWNPEVDSYHMISNKEFSRWNGNPVWNPQYDQILYFSWDEFEDDTLGVVALDNLERWGIRWGAAADWFPDGTKVVINNLKRITVIDLLTEKSDEIWQTLSLQMSSLAVSPDGENIVLSASHVGEANGGSVILIGVDGENERLLFESQGNSTHIGWSPDGKVIAAAVHKDSNHGILFFETQSDFIQSWLDSTTCSK
jgi:Tol biopolymer transport system component